MFNPVQIRRLGLLFILFTFVTLLCFSQGNRDSEKLRNIINIKGQVEVTIPYKDLATTDMLTRNVSVRSVRENNVYIVLSPLTAEWFIASGFDYSIIERDDHKGIISSQNLAEAMQWETYPTHSQYDSIMSYFATNYPSICRLDTVGTSVMGRLITALKISDNCDKDEIEPEVFYTSTIHGDETGGFILMLRLADYLLKNYDLDTRVKNLVDNLEIWINPLANPDGTYKNSEIIESPVRFNANNFDLNRNFPDPLAPFTLRQKETLDMMRFLARHRFILSANFHSGEEVVNYPWDRWPREHPDNEWFYRISRAYADTVHLHAIPGYMDYLDNGVTNGYAWYKVYGGRQDYVTYDLQGREVTVELDNDFITPVQNLDALWEYNWRSLLGYLENATEGIGGLVTDALSGNPVPARIFIEGHDADNSYVFSDTISGEYFRLLSPGSWDLTFTADGYQTRIISDVVLLEGEKRSHDVELNSIQNPVDTANTGRPVLYPNPGNAYIRAVLPRDILGNINIRIFSQTGVILSDYNTTYYYGNPVMIDLRSLSSGFYIVVFTGTDTGVSYKSKIIVTGGGRQ